MTQTPISRAATLSAIDKEVDVARQLTRSLLSCHNALVPISALPPELLARIFHFHALWEPSWLGEHKLGWIGVTHVCRHWRQVALDDSSLWARIRVFSHRPQWFSEMLVRARNASLSIDILGTPSPEVLSMFPTHISHTRELLLRSMTASPSLGVREICSSDAPALEHFELGISAADPVNFFQIAGTTLFNGRAPKLRTFSLYQISIPWSLIPRGQLTELKVNTQRGINHSDISSPSDSLQLIDLLTDSPDLEVLALEFCIPTMLSQVSRGQSINLPRLSRLCLGGSTASITNLLKMLKLPSSASLHLQCISENSSTHPDHLILPLISAHFHNPTPVEFKIFRVTANCSERLIDVAASIVPPKSTLYHQPVLGDNEAELMLSFDGLPESTQADTLGRVCSVLPISNLELLSISAPDTIQSVNWYELFQRCKNATTIQARGRGTISLLQALAPRATDTTPGRKGKKWKRGKGATQAQAANNTSAMGARAITTPFPKLMSLLLENLNLGVAVPFSGTLYDVLMNVLRQRKTRKTPLETLCVERCAVTTNRANSLKNHVQQFCWDGDEGFSYDEWDDDYDYSSDFTSPPRLEDFFNGTTQSEWEWFANYSP